MEAGATAGGSSANVQSPPASAAATAAKSLLYHDYANDSKLSISLRRYKLKDQVVCPNCGQFHEPHGTHLYDYHQAVDEDLMCQICLQPLVNPLDTRCGHTFCSRCLHNYLKIQSQCPVDRQRLDDIDIQQSSILVRRLLDKLLVVCPNVDYCEEVLPRSELEAHLLHRCRGAVTRCIKSSLGCTFQGPRSALQSHLWECPYRDQDGGKNPVMDGEVSTIEIQRTQADLGISVVGGCDTPLACIVIQEIFPDGVIAKDSRLLPGDQILEVNGEDLTQATHYQAQQLLGQYYPVCRLTVYREKAEESRPIEKEEILKITLNKVKGRQLGIKLVGKRSGPGVYILSLEGKIYTQCRIIVKSKGDNSLCFRMCQTLKTVTLLRSPSGSLGFSVVGGVDSEKGIPPYPVYVKSVVLDTPAAKDGRLKCGDILLSVNEDSLQSVTHTKAVDLLKMADGAVSLTVVSWPGTIV
ncbi:ligand of Numb protein X 2-like [Mizuhopecten yessoensis]|uniref:ligand of Numb protein X 2-like n=1 Tax=Mizuhopecten yessoensis TaxID=6573 RepID=UPI000B458780|nr:ligand of Numb protein X 2-like [Mizuhopecten yessoensis]